MISAKWPARLLIAFVCWPVVALGLGMAVSKWMWNYPLDRPPTLSSTREFGSIRSITPFVSEGITYRYDPSISVLDAAQADNGAGGYYTLQQRILVDLKGSGKLLTAPATNEEWLERVRRMVFDSGILADSADGYDSNREHRGFAIDYTTPAGEERSFVTLTGQEVSNDHYPFYEAVFSMGSRPKLLKRLMFYYDVAGLEGAEWQALSIVSLVFLLPVVLALWGLNERRINRQVNG